MLQLRQGPEASLHCSGTSNEVVPDESGNRPASDLKPCSDLFAWESQGGAGGALAWKRAVPLPAITPGKAVIPATAVAPLTAITPKTAITPETAISPIATIAPLTAITPLTAIVHLTAITPVIVVTCATSQ
jgi:hypothetical protein